MVMKDRLLLDNRVITQSGPIPDVSIYSKFGVMWQVACSTDK